MTVYDVNLSILLSPSSKKSADGAMSGSHSFFLIFFIFGKSLWDHEIYLERYFETNSTAMRATLFQRGG